jgi:hypothetical protein
VPDIELVHDPEIKAKYDEKKAAGTLPVNAEDFDAKMQDPTFVARLEKTMTQWFRDIRRIT